MLDTLTALVRRASRLEPPTPIECPDATRRILLRTAVDGGTSSVTVDWRDDGTLVIDGTDEGWPAPLTLATRLRRLRIIRAGGSPWLHEIEVEADGDDGPQVVRGYVAMRRREPTLIYLVED